MAKNTNQTSSGVRMSADQDKKLAEKRIKTMVTLSGIPFKKLKHGSSLLSGNSKQSTVPVVKGHFDSLYEKFGDQGRTASA